MTTPDDEALKISYQDLVQHVVTYGLDIFPPLDVRNEVTRTHDLFQSLQDRWPELYQELNFRPQSGELKVLALFEFRKGSVKFPTLTLTQRGPIFAFPRRFPDPLGEYDYKENLDEVFLSSLAVMRTTFPGLDVLRLGLVQEAVFSTGKTNSVPYLANRFGTFPKTNPKGGNVTLTFRDDQCNVQIKIETVEIRKQAQVRTIGRVLSDELTYGVKIKLDVNNVELRPQEPSDIETTLVRAHGLWPEELLRFINWKGIRDDNDRS